MKDFFTFYQYINEIDTPFIAFQILHILLLCISICLIAYFYHKYNTFHEAKKQRFLKGMAIYFLVEEFIYITWLMLTCHENVWMQVLPLELCSICAYLNACTVFFKKEYLRFFSGVVGLVAGLVAMLYPANISGLYPVVSYRVLNFYMLHGAFVLFALIQLKDHSLLRYVNIRKNTMMVFIMFTTAFLVNLVLKTQYMFVGTPPQLGFMNVLFHLTGIVFFLPVVLVVVFLLQYIVVYILRKVYRIT